MEEQANNKRTIITIIVAAVIVFLVVGGIKLGLSLSFKKLPHLSAELVEEFSKYEPDDTVVIETTKSEYKFVDHTVRLFDVCQSIGRSSVSTKATVYGGKLYFCAFDRNDDKSIYVCRCDFDGQNAEEITSSKFTKRVHDAFGHGDDLYFRAGELKYVYHGKEDHEVDDSDVDLWCYDIKRDEFLRVGAAGTTKDREFETEFIDGGIKIGFVIPDMVIDEKLLSKYDFGRSILKYDYHTSKAIYAGGRYFLNYYIYTNEHDSFDQVEIILEYHEEDRSLSFVYMHYEVGVRFSDVLPL